MSNTVNENPQALVSANEHPQRSSPTRRVAASQSDLELIERSHAFLEVMKQVDSVSITDLPVLLIGEPGTGKQLVACAIHQRSGRSDHPFIPVNCSAVPADSIEAELFGIDPSRPGFWQKADRGTLFIDEITETNSSVQAKIWQTLQTGQISRHGSDETQPVNVRLIAASSRNLGQEVEAGRFHEELLLALRTLTIVLPPLPKLEATEQRSGSEDWVTLSEIEGRYVARVLKHTGGNKQAAARVLSVDRKTLDRMIKRHHIDYPHARHRAKASLSS
jgi:DNA-binding NtrC family response regulator